MQGFQSCLTLIRGNAQFIWERAKQHDCITACYKEHGEISDCDYQPHSTLLCPSPHETQTHTCQDCILNAFFGIKNVSVLGASSFVDFGLEVVVNEICRLDPTERVMWFSFKTNTGGFSVVI